LSNNSYSHQDSCDYQSEDEEDHTVKITDFGLAHIISQGNTKAYLKYSCGSFGYSAPEKKNVSYLIYL
jgi:serine/threonine protein kinase